MSILLANKFIVRIIDTLKLIKLVVNLKRISQFLKLVRVSVVLLLGSIILGATNFLPTLWRSVYLFECVRFIVNIDIDNVVIDVFCTCMSLNLQPSFFNKSFLDFDLLVDLLISIILP